MDTIIPYHIPCNDSQPCRSAQTKGIKPRGASFGLWPDSGAHQPLRTRKLFPICQNGGQNRADTQCQCRTNLDIQSSRLSITTYDNLVINTTSIYDVYRIRYIMSTPLSSGGWHGIKQYIYPRFLMKAWEYIKQLLYEFNIIEGYHITLARNDTPITPALEAMGNKGGAYVRV